MKELMPLVLASTASKGSLVGVLLWVLTISIAM